jgi:rhamnulokinase
MKPVHCAAVDLGATSGRVIVGTWANHRLALREVHRFPNQFRSLAGGDYWDLPYLWSETCAGLREARRQFPRLASIGIDGWAVDHVLVNAAGRPVHPVHAYRDTRTAALSARLDRHGLGRIYALTGIPNYAYNTSLQLQETLRACPAMARAAARCLFIPEYFNFLLSGRMENEFSLASHSQLLDVHGDGWSAAALRFFHVPGRWFSGPVRSPRILGPVTGLPELKGVRSVLVPGHDTACAFTAMPAAANGTDLYLSSGTRSLHGF